MRILVTGASGFVGRSLCRFLATNSHAVVASVRDQSRFLQSGLAPTSGQMEVVQVASLGPSTDWRQILGDVDAVVHCAARVHVMNDTSVDATHLYQETNARGTQALATQAAEIGVKRFILISSIKVNGETTEAGRPFTADSQPNPTDPYGQSKLDAETALARVCETSDMDFVVIRPPLMYGPGVKANFHSLIRSIDRGIPLPLGAATRNRRSLLALSNLNDLIHTCLTHPAASNQTFLASDGEDLSTAELIRKIGDALGKPARLVTIPETIIKWASMISGKAGVYERLFGSLQIDISKNRKLLGWQPPVSVDAGLADTVRAYESRLRSREHLD